LDLILILSKLFSLQWAASHIESQEHRQFKRNRILALVILECNIGLDINFMDAINGIVKTLKYTKLVQCPSCKGNKRNTLNEYRLC
jgi:DnaJ-class molecular chaperone